MAWMVFFAKLLSPNFKQIAKESNKIQLVTIGFSHYCELAAWCLKAEGIPFTEHAYGPAQHVLPAIALRVGGKSEKHLSSSSRMTVVVSPNQTPEEAAKIAAREVKRDKSARSTAVPVAVDPHGEVWADSWDIATKTGLPEIDPTMKKLLDEKVGIWARQLSYHYVLSPRNNNIFNQLFTINSSWWWKLLWWLFLSSNIKQAMVKMMKPYDQAAVTECRNNLNTTLNELNTIVLSKKTKFLYTDATIGVSDIAVAALIGPLVNPPEYCEGRYKDVFNMMIAQDPEARAEMERVRSMPIGKYVMELYADHR